LTISLRVKKVEERLQRDRGFSKRVEIMGKKSEREKQEEILYYNFLTPFLPKRGLRTEPYRGE
jgi:hypothetical protein